jgi:hypothetical protein
MFTLSQFKQNFKVTRPNNFYVEVDLPAYLKNAFLSKSSLDLAGSAVRSGSTQAWFKNFSFNTTTGVNDTFKFRCEATEFPGRTIATAEDVSFGPTTKHAYDTTYGDINLTIIAAEDMRERIFFDVWMENIVNNTNLTGGIEGKGALIKYYQEYADGQVRIFHYDENNKVVARCTLYEAYPILLSGMNLTWEEQNSYQRFSVTMTYRYHIVEFG